MIILEGPDGSGKTTLANLLVAEGYTYEHMGPPGPTENLFRTYQAAIHNTGDKVVCDRLFHGEAVYGPLLRGVSRLSTAQLAYLELEAAARGALVVWCTAEPEALVSRGDPIYQTISVMELRRRYEELARWSRLEKVLYDSTALNPRTMLQQLLALHVPSRCLFRAVGGSFNPVALLGDKLGGAKTQGDWPKKDDQAWTTHYRHFRPFDHGGSHDYLMESLLLIQKYSPHDTYVTNALQQHSSRPGLLREELMAVKPRRVVCLGAEAEKEYLKTGLRGTLTRVPHPAYWRRFEHHDKAGYAQLLKEAMGL